MTELSKMFDSAPAGADRAGLADAFNGTAPAEVLDPLPAGEYQARAVNARLDETRTGTPFYGVRLEVVTGEHTGRLLWGRWYLSPAALPYSRRDLAALGLDAFAKLERGDVPGGLLRVRVALRRDDDGTTRNEVRAVLPGAPPPLARPPVSAPPAPPAEPVPPEPQTAPAPPAGVDDLPAGLVDRALL